MTRWLGGIRRKLAISFSLLVSAFAVLMVVFYPNRLEQQARSALIARAEAVRDMTAYSLSAGLYFGDSSAIREVLDGASRDAEVTLLEVRDLAGRLTTIRRDAGAMAHDTIVGGGYVAPDGATYITSTLVLHGTTQVGTLHLGLSLAAVRKDVRAARQLGLIVGALILIIGLALVYTVSTLVTRPLLDVVDTARRIAAGDLSLRAPATSDADVSQLVNAVNSMVDSLAGAQSELARINAELEARVQARTAELESLIELAPTAIVEVDLAWHVTRWNRSATKLFGWTADEAIGHPIPYVTEEHLAEFSKNQARLIATGTLPALDVAWRRKDGSPVHVLVSAGKLSDELGRPTGYLAFVTDLTERKSLEEQLRQAQKMEAVGRLAGGIAHDFNNILTVITACAALLRDTSVTTEQREDIEQIVAAAQRAAALTNQLLTFSRQEVVQLEPVNLSNVVHSMDPMLRRLLRENIRVTTSLGREVGVVTADRRQLERVLLNLVVNASDAMPQGGALTTETRNVRLDEAFTQRYRGMTPGNYVLLSVRDTGVGIDAETIQNIFDPFFTTKEVGKGTGLGLATVYTVATQLGGCVDVVSSKGNGATFNVYLPLTGVQPAAEAASSAIAGPTGGGRETVLLVEDEEPVRRVLRRTLERLGYSVLDAGSGEDGLAVSKSHDGSIDIVVTDLMMPGMNGREFADRLHATKPELRVVFISGYIEERVRQGGLVDANHAFLRKPFTGPELDETIRALLDRTPRTTTPT